MIKLERNKNIKREVWDLIAIKGKISKILNKYEIEVYFVEENGIKYYEFFYHPSHAGFFVEQTTEITEKEIISSFKEMLALLKNPIEKQKIIDNFIKIERYKKEFEFEMVREDIDNYEKQIEDFVLEAQGIKKRHDIRLRFKLLKKTDKNLWEFKTDKYIFKLKYESILNRYALYCFEQGKESQSFLNAYNKIIPKNIEDCIVLKLEEGNIEREKKEYINKIDWSKAVRGISWNAKEFKISLNKDGTLYCGNKNNLGKRWNYDIVKFMDVYDKDGNCLSSMKEYEKVWIEIYDRAIKNGYKKYEKFK
jgi:hypothetical protein